MGVALVAVVVYVWFQDHSSSDDSSSSPSRSDDKRRRLKSPSVSPPQAAVSSERKQQALDDNSDDEGRDEVSTKEEAPPDDGVIKYDCQWTRGSISYSSIGPLLAARNRLHGMGLIGVYQHGKNRGIGFGNISVRSATDKASFFITGTQTGNVEPEQMNESHFSVVTRCDIAGNTLYCRGPVRPSSEGLTHGAVYALDEGIECVVHVHHHRLWTECLNRIATTDCNVPYGTPEMAREVERLYEDDGRLRKEKAFVMGGHEDGLISFGKSIEEAMDVMVRLYREMQGGGCLEVAGNGSPDSAGSENRSNGIGSSEHETTEESSTSEEHNGHSKMNVNIIDDYATPILSGQINGPGPNKSNGFVEVDSDNLVL